MSTLRKALEQLRGLAPQVPLLESVYPLSEPSFHDPASPSEIESLERAIATPLPAEYREFLSLCSGIDAMDVWNGYAVHGIELVLRILVADESPSEHEGEKLVPFGGDGGGNMFMIALPSGKVLKWRHDIYSAPFAEMASSFATFLERMALDWTHFIEDDREWKYMSG